MNKRTFPKLPCSFFLVSVLYLAPETVCFAQTDPLHDCRLLERVMNDSAVKKYLFAHNFNGFFNEHSSFNNCRTLNIAGKNYAMNDSIQMERWVSVIYDSISQTALSYYPVSFYAFKNTKDVIGINLDWIPYEHGLQIILENKNGKYVVAKVYPVLTD